MADKQEIKALQKAISEIEAIALDFGLDFFDMRFEICPADIIYTFGAYGMPTRFSHWSFGKAFHKMKTSYDYNLSRIYELVINSNPCYAFLLEGNSLVQNKMVIAHVYAHCDFFKNNRWFARTDRQMVDIMAVHALRIADYEFHYGFREVEKFLDAVLSIQEHINPHQIKEKDGRPVKEKKPEPAGSYADLWQLDSREIQDQEEEEENNKKLPEKDLLKFIMENSLDLTDWQRDIIAMIRSEMYYFWPQLETKIMNEGWATFWHVRIMRELALTEDEAIEFAKLHAGISQPNPYHINPYLVGWRIWEHLDKKYGRDELFLIREVDHDQSFLRNYLNEELVEELDLYLYQKVGQNWQITEKKWEQIRDNLVFSLNNCGFPYIEVVDGDYNKRHELYLLHRYEGIELDTKYLEKTLHYVSFLWGRPVHLETVIDNKRVLFTSDGFRSSKRLL
ncbi:stage V sporulation protein R [Carboxydocella sporoproducens DSM 16521]|uniref:Stage V sporulation protein R n=2 Tax=Carboxydocella TaxID=178898 RepID=A0A1T4RJR6_9FIRM|nr:MULTISPECIES: SpoVR family protein [Carboxydocella]AVX20785.1 stage V sporulation protein R [Carboxydocella thermautotrophica]AVX31204.1 stage V sporulation protein R [Carboxydocella thermautotrophica]SKA15988.1 stage V sporulation protein R [Carboxydocella sporoproducens DSM 16521]